MTDATPPDLHRWAGICHAEPQTPVDTLATCLARIDHDNPTLRAVIEVDRACAQRAAGDSADRWARDAALSPIDGAPILVKANVAVAGLPWHAGIAAYRDRRADVDAPVVKRLRDAGAIILGLTNMDEGALGASGENAWLGRIGNPCRPGFSVGGSSGGSAAAVAAGFCMAALGSDTIGSIAIPAALCGIVGHRASRDAMSIDGIAPLSPSFDHGGWHTRSTGGALALYEALGARTSGAQQFRIAALSLDVAQADAAVTWGVERAQASGLTIERMKLTVAFSDVARLMFEVAEAEGAIVHRQALLDRPQDFSPGFRRMLAWGAGKGAEKREANLAALADVAAAVRGALIGYDALLLPATPIPGFAAGTPPPSDLAMFAAIPACLGWPATTIPAADQTGVAVLVTAPSDGACLTIADRIVRV